MNIKAELLQNYITESVSYFLQNMEFDETKIADTAAIMALSEIKNIINDESLSDFEAIEDIIFVFNKYRIDFGSRHDF